MAAEMLHTEIWKGFPSTKVFWCENVKMMCLRTKPTLKTKGSLEMLSDYFDIAQKVAKFMTSHAAWLIVLPLEDIQETEKNKSAVAPTHKKECL